jgi:hypothetical protein
MSLEIDHREREGVNLMDLKGRITMGDEVSTFRAAFEKVADQQEPKLILPLAERERRGKAGKR